jgi:8-oxo-dGTP diphosphatase
MNIRPSVVIIENLKLLTLRYNYNNANVYGLPGGNVDFGETLVNTVKRELAEELQIEIEVVKLLFIAEVHQNNKSTLHNVFEAKIKSGQPLLNPKETTAIEICWLDIDHLLEFNLYPNIGSNLIKYQKSENENQEIFLGTIKQPWF